MIKSFQRKGQSQRLRRSFNRSAGEHLSEQLPKQRGRGGMARQNIGREDGKGAPASTALAAIGTKDPLAADQLSIGLGGVVALEKAVPV